MTDTHRPKPCHRDRGLDTRVTKAHADDCPTHDNTGPCPGRDGCQPCTANHCTSCRWRHTTPDHPITCPDCVLVTRTDLDDIRWNCRHLRWHAVRGGHNGQLLAAAPIPGGDAMVLMARAGAVLEDLVWAKTIDDDHHPDDVVPVLLPLIVWDTRIRQHYSHRLPARPSVTGITHYLADRLTDLAQDPTADWPSLAFDMAALRRQLERVLHDEQEPEQGVSCFECGDRLVRRFGKPKPCRHRTPGRVRLEQIEADAEAARERLAVLATYPELGAPSYADLRAARRVPTAAEESAARRPCEKCTTSRDGQGGIEDPAVGQSWECEGCRKAYTSGEYANAVRADLLQGGPDGDGWTHVAMAAEAASTMTGHLFPPGTVRRWMDRGQVAACCRVTFSVVDRATPVERLITQPGLRLVLWDDVADQAAASVARHLAAEQERRLRAEQFEKWSARVASGLDAKEAGVRLGIHPARVARFVEELEALQAEQEAS